MKSSQKNINQELEQIRKALENFKEGASIEEIRETTGLVIPIRTMQRRLERLIEQGFVTTSGKTHTFRYHLTKEDKKAESSEEPERNFIQLTDKSKKILSIINRPEQSRNPVGYNRDFLNLYKPNVNSYLTEDERKKLTEIGKTEKFNQPAGTYAKEILNRLLIDLSWNSSRLEGNTYSLLDTERLISLGQAAENKPATDAQMILNHKDAIEFIVQAEDNIGFNRYTILNLHALLSNNLLPNPAASGKLRRFGVGIHQSVYIPLSIPQQIEEMFDLMLEKADAIKDPFEQAFFIMVQLPYLQPFDDVNKRVSRLAANIPLNKHNLAPLSFIDVPNEIYIQSLIGVYELNKVDLLKDTFFWAYQRSSARYAALQQSLGEPDLFLMKYRNPIRSLIAEIVSNTLAHKEAAALINKKVEELPEKDREKFIESVETELMSLHEGNFARYRIRPSEFKLWKEAWGKK